MSRKNFCIGRAPVAPHDAESNAIESDAPLSCPKAWDTLEATDRPGARHCADCEKTVFEVDIAEQVHEAAREDLCIAVAEDSSYFRERNDAMTHSPDSPDSSFRRHLATVTLLVHDYDEAIRFFTEALRFDLVEDTPRGPGKRWVVVAPSRNAGAALLLAKAVTDEQEAGIGRQASGRVFLFLHTQDFAADHEHMKAHGVRFLEEPRNEPHGTVAVFQDLCGNRWDLLQPA